MIAVAIDGPGGAGKSTMARAAALKLGFIYVDTGALYRAIGLYMLRSGIPAADGAAVAAILPKLTVSLTFQNGEQRVLLCGEDVSGEIRTPEASMAASQVSAVPEVRAFLFEQQRKLARENNAIMDGRDIGTVVLPDAQVKIFLTASAEERAHRRYEEMLQKGERADYQTVLEELKTRDYQDSHRAIAPLVPAEDAILFDTTGKGPEECLNQLLCIIRQKIGGAGGELS